MNKNNNNFNNCNHYSYTIYDHYQHNGSVTVTTSTAVNDTVYEPEKGERMTCYDALIVIKQGCENLIVIILIPVIAQICAIMTGF
ncbi:MAG: hypothetical protein WCF23_16115 [Candidatus Nitrosopolaris sp.]